MQISNLKLSIIGIVISILLIVYGVFLEFKEITVNKCNNYVFNSINENQKYKNMKERLNISSSKKNNMITVKRSNDNINNYRHKTSELNKYSTASLNNTDKSLDELIKKMERIATDNNKSVLGRFLDTVGTFMMGVFSSICAAELFARKNKNNPNRYIKKNKIKRT